MIEKKDSALKTIDNLINETIVPKLDQLKKEQSGLMEFQKVTAELEALTKVYIAYNFLKEEKNCEQASANVEEKIEQIKAHRKDIEDAQSKAQEIANQVKEFEKKKDEEFGGKLSELEEELKTEQLSEAKLMGELNLAKENLKEEEKKMSQLVKNLEGDRRITASKQKQFDSLSDNLERLKADNERNEENLKKAEKDYEDISAGKSRAQEGEAAATLADQLMTAQKEIANAETDAKKAEMKLKHSRSELTKKESEVKKIKSTYDQDMKEIDSMNSEVERLRVGFEGIGFDEQKHSDLSTNLNLIKRQINTLSDQISNAESQLGSRVRFDYKHPHPNFDRRDVLGVVCNLFRLKDINYALAVEKAAGGSLFNVVVKDEQTGKALLERGQLRERRTIVPLDRIQGREPDRRALRRAQDIVGRENVDFAINYIEYDPSLAVTMRHVFGDTLIVPNMETAKRIVYEPGVQKKAVTIDGEVFEPSGVLSGGSSGQGMQMLVKVAEISDKKQQLEELKNELNRMDSELRQMNTEMKRYSELKQKYELKAREAELVRQRLQSGTQHILMQEIEELKQIIQTEEQVLIECAEIKKNSSKKVQELQNKLKDSKSIRERELKEAEQQLKNARTQAEKSRKALAGDQQRGDTLQLEIQELSKAMVACEESLKDFETTIDKIRSQTQTLEEKVNQVKERVSEMSAKLKEHKKLLKSHSDEIAKMQKQREVVLKSANDNELKIKQLKYDIDNIKKSSEDSARNVKYYKKKYSWIESERHLFGNESAGYGFDNFDQTDVSRRLERFKAHKASLAKTVNMRANIMLSDKEKESEELARKRKIVSTDKNNLINYMQEVDQKKKNALHDAWKKINEDFGSIFATFLPNTTAKLEAPEGKSVVDGLEVKVAFGDVWKESLTELSGGQRSLVALSLILALLKFNPAPLYILDEVDAALDQSHTQNTGIMIRKHFRNSQVTNVYY